MLRRLRTLDLLRVLLVASIVGPALVFVVLGTLTYKAAFADAKREVAWTSEVAREHAAKVFDGYKLVADRIADILDGADDASIRGSEEAIHARIVDVVRDLPQIQSVIVVDRAARALVATGASPCRARPTSRTATTSPR